MVVDLRLGDCLDVMAHLEPNSIDSIITDPPYGLEFMGKEWDRLTRNLMRPESEADCQRVADYAGSYQGRRSNLPDIGGGAKYAREMQDWHYRWAVAALRVAKPGAILMAFGGTRTFHRLACAIEDAGWEIRDTMMWVYGCLSEDTEILVEGRWERYNNAIARHRALCYNVDKDTYEWQPIQEVFVYDYDETAYSIPGTRTDQLVSRNHRCLVWREGGWRFVLAEEAALEHEICVPVLEDVPRLLKALPDIYKGTGGAKQNMQQGMCEHIRERSANAKADGRTEDDAGNLSELREGNVANQCPASQGKTVILQQVLSSETSNCSDFDSAQIRQDRDEVSGDRDEGGGESCLERGRDVFQDTRQLCGCQICEMPAGMAPDGAEGRLCDGTQADCCAGTRPVSFENGSGTSCRSRSHKQCLGQPSTICQQSGSQEVRGEGYTSSDLARIEPVHYRGKMWCVRVPSGAFVARRNGKVFVTGNSGFPKSHDISKGIDKASGVAVSNDGYIPNLKNNDYGHAFGGGQKTMVPTPSTDLAVKWSGWGTALKPAWEPIIIAMKPCDGTFAQNAEKWGVAGLWIDGGRVPIGARDDIYAKNPHTLGTIGENGIYGAGKPTLYEVGKGRWPANLIHDGSDEVVGLFPMTTSGAIKAGQPAGRDMRAGDVDHSRVGGRPSQPIDVAGSTGSAARFFKTCPLDSVCILCGSPYEQEHGIMSATEVHIPCSNNARTADKHSNQNSTTPALVSVADSVLQVPLQEGGDKSGSSLLLANNAESSSWITRETSGCSVQGNVRTTTVEKTAQRAKSVASLCDSCATAFALALAEQRHHRKPESIPGWASICVRGGPTLTQCLVSFAALLGSTDIIPTTESLSLFFGSVSHAIASYMERQGAQMGNEICQVSRLAYHSKASRSEREAGLEGMEHIAIGHNLSTNACARCGKRIKHNGSGDGCECGELRETVKLPAVSRNHHPTVKPLALMRYLCRLTKTPTGGVVLDPFMGSGTTGCAAVMEGRSFIGIEKEEEYMKIAKARIQHAQPGLL